MTTCRPNCGACCDPVTIGYSVPEAHALHRAGRLSKDQFEWITKVLEPMTAKEAKRIAPYLFAGRFRNAVDPDGGVITFYYRCSWFDRETRTCTHYDERPSVCRRYPWVGGAAQGNEALPPMCSFNETIGNPVAPVPVAWLGVKQQSIDGTVPDV